MMKMIKRLFGTNNEMSQLFKKNKYYNKTYERNREHDVITKAIFPTFVGVSILAYLKNEWNGSNRTKLSDLINTNINAHWQEEPKLNPDLYKNRISIVQYPVNNPCEDRFQVSQFDKTSGYYAAVFDGHGGWQISNHAMKKLHLYLDIHLKSAFTSSQIYEGINKAFDQFENECYDLCKSAFDIGFPESATVGSCAIMAIVKGNKLYVANWGDCEGVLLRKKTDGSLESIQIWKAYSANDPEEQQRLNKQFPNETDIVICKRPDAWYVKGALMPSRSFGDFRLKHPEFNSHSYDAGLGFRAPIKDYTGPYISYKPDIREFELTKDDVYLVLATDGLWDNIKVPETGEVLQKDNCTNSQDIPKCLLNTALNRISEEKGMSRDYIEHLPPGKLKRNIVDDITIVVVNLQNQVV